MIPPPRHRLIIIAAAALVLVVCGALTAVWLTNDDADPLGAVPDPDIPPYGEDVAFTEADIILTGGTVIDGTGARGFTGDVAIQGDRIIFVGDAPPDSTGLRVDCSGLVIAPGFINSHSHTFEVIFDHPGAGSALLQGITTEVGGVDGRSPSPLADHFDRVAELPPGVNYALLVGQGTVRSAVMGDENRPASEAEIEEMQELVSRAMQAGALGLSTGLEYIPGLYTPTEELVSLARTAAEYGGVYVTHMRCEGDDVLAAAAEAILIGEEAGISVGISHLKTVNPSNWHLHDKLMTLLDDARERALAEDRDLWCDVYPYLSPDYAVNVPLAQAVSRYPPEMILPKSSRWQPPEHASIPGGSDPVFHENTLTDLAGEYGLTPDAMAERILSGEPDVRARVVLMSHRNLVEILRWEGSVIANDASARDPAADTYPNRWRHPRAYGSFPRVLARFVDEHLPLHEAVTRMTGMPARLLGIEERGFVLPGMYADIVIFDPDEIADTSTYTYPRSYPVGIHHVLVNGEFVVRDGELLPEVRAGRVIR